MGLFVAHALFAGGGALLCLSGASHVRRRKQFLAVLISHGVMPYQLCVQVAAVFPVLILAQGAASLAAFAGAGAGTLGSSFLTAASVAASSTFLLLLVYVLVALRRGVSGECGCFANQSIGISTAARLLILLVGAVITALVSPPHEVAGTWLPLLAGCGGAILVSRPTRVGG